MEHKLQNEFLNRARKKERQVVTGLFGGLKNNAICKRYNIPKQTLKQIISRLCARYGITDNDGLRSETNRIKLIVKLFYAGCCPCSDCRSNRGGLRAAGKPTPSEHAFDIESHNAGFRPSVYSMRKRSASKAKISSVSGDAIVRETMQLGSEARR